MGYFELHQHHNFSSIFQVQTYFIGTACVSWSSEVLSLVEIKRGNLLEAAGVCSHHWPVKDRLRVVGITWFLGSQRGFFSPHKVKRVFVWEQDLGQMKGIYSLFRSELLNTKLFQMLFNDRVCFLLVSSFWIKLLISCGHYTFSNFKLLLFYLLLVVVLIHPFFNHRFLTGRGIWSLRIWKNTLPTKS